jgi:hypothetical protein
VRSAPPAYEPDDVEIPIEVWLEPSELLVDAVPEVDLETVPLERSMPVDVSVSEAPPSLELTPLLGSPVTAIGPEVSPPAPGVEAPASPQMVQELEVVEAESVVEADVDVAPADVTQPLEPLLGKVAAARVPEPEVPPSSAPDSDHGGGAPEFRREPATPRGNDVASLLRRFAHNLERPDQDLRRDLKSIAGIDETAPPPKAG